MDVTGFVGFAARGPLDTPVAVEEIDAFRDIYGDDLPLAWDPAQGQPRYSLLGPTVESFFRNGGRRCWVVRVADRGEAAPLRHRFPLPALCRADTTAAARVQARAAGNWAQTLGVATRLRSRRLPSPHLAVGGAAGNRHYTVTCFGLPLIPLAGELLELRLPDTGLRVFLYTDEHRSEGGHDQLLARRGVWFEEPMPSASPPDPFPAEIPPLRLSEEDALAMLPGGGSPGSEIHGWSQRFDLLCWEGDRLLGTIQELGFDPRHPRYWGRLPTDETLYALRDRELLEAPETLQLMSELQAPRFAFAAMDPVGSYLPLGMPLTASAGNAFGPLNIGGTSNAEGLGRFSADLFLDPQLAGSGLGALPGEADHRRYVRREPLLGLHAFYGVEEVSLVTVPDAGHRRWDREPEAPEPRLEAPDVPELSAVDERGRRRLSWQPVTGAREYRLQRADNPEFADSQTLIIGRPDLMEVLAGNAASYEPETELWLRLDEATPRVHYFRLQTVGHGALSVWSGTLAVHLPEADFHACAQPRAEAMGLALGSLALGPELGRRLQWSATAAGGLDPGVNRFELQRSADFHFVAPQTLYLGPDLQFDTAVEVDVEAFYRVRALAPAVTGPWSNTVVHAPALLARDTLRQPADYQPDQLLAVQRALLRLCAARADAVALLSLPEHYREEDVASHLSALRPSDTGGDHTAGVTPLRRGEAAAMDFGALFHPWLVRGAVADTGASTVARLPADGAVAGLLADRANRRGAWISAANQPMTGVLGLHPPPSAGVDVAGVNTIRQGPRGFLLERSDTLTAEGELRALSVRRLLILLRRLVRREGNRYVFEPNGEAFRDAVQQQWEELLHDLYVRGAFRGSQPDDAYRVASGGALNPPQSVAAGRLVVELQVAPSQPLHFVTVRLVQNGADQLLVQEG